MRLQILFPQHSLYDQIRVFTDDGKWVVSFRSRMTDRVYFLSRQDDILDDMKHIHSAERFNSLQAALDEMNLQLFQGELPI